MAAAEINGLLACTQAVFTASRVVKLSLQSNTTSTCCTMANKLSTFKASSIGLRTIYGFTCCKCLAAAWAFGEPISLSRYNTCRCKLETSTVSKSASHNSPTPALAKYKAAGQPKPPIPTIKALEALMRS